MLAEIGDLLDVLGSLIRIVIIFMGFGAMWALWVARDKRKHLWTHKMKDIWMCHMLFVASTVTANIEQLYRGSQPPGSLLVIAFTYLWTIKGTFNGDFYTKEVDFHKFDED